MKKTCQCGTSCKSGKASDGAVLINDITREFSSVSFRGGMESVEEYYPDARCLETAEKRLWFWRGMPNVSKSAHLSIP